MKRHPLLPTKTPNQGCYSLRSKRTRMQIGMEHVHSFEKHQALTRSFSEAMMRRIKTMHNFSYFKKHCSDLQNWIYHTSSAMTPKTNGENCSITRFQFIGKSFMQLKIFQLSLDKYNKSSSLIDGIKIQLILKQDEQ